MSKSIKHIGIVILATVAILWINFHKIIGHFNSFLFDDQVDGFKSYYNFSYMLRYGNGVKHTGINYPYGEHIHMVNSHPLYLYIANALDGIIPLSDCGPAIINVGILFSIIVAAPILYLILREFKLPHWYAVIFAIIIQFNYAQFDRINAHFEMAIAFVIPAYWYLMIKYRTSEHRTRYAVFMIIFSLVCGLISAYFVAFCSIFALAILLVESWQHRKDLKPYVKNGVRLLAIAIIPLICLKVYVDMTDWAMYRPTDPWGFYEYNSNPLGIFLPDTSIIKSILPSRMYDYEWEGRAYVGLVGALLALSIVIHTIYQFIKTKKLDFQPFSKNKELNVYLVAAFIVLLYAMCWPFKWGLHWIADEITLLKQFRGLGRFSWVFYYVFSVYTAHFLYNELYKKIRSKHSQFAGLLILILAIGQWSMDSMINLKKSSNKTLSDNNYLSPSDDEYIKMIEDSGNYISDYQAIVSIPFNQTNGDKMLFHKGSWAWKMAMTLSYHTGLPLVQCFSPRLSFPNSVSSIQLLADPCIEKVRLKDMNQKPLIVLESTERKRPVDQRFLDLGRRIYKDDNITLYHLNLDTLTQQYGACINNYRNLLSRFNDRDKVITASGTGDYYYKGFENEKYVSDVSFSGERSFYKRKGEVVLFNENLSEYGLKGNVEISFWMHLEIKKAGLPHVYLDIIDKNGKLVKSRYFYSRETHDVKFPWIRDHMKFTINPAYRYQLRAEGEDISIDDVLIKSLNEQIIIRRKNLNLYNNFPFEHE